MQRRKKRWHDRTEAASKADNKEMDREEPEKGADPPTREHPAAREARDAASEKADAGVAGDVSRETVRGAGVSYRRIPK